MVFAHRNTSHGHLFINLINVTSIDATEEVDKYNDSRSSYNLVVAYTSGSKDLLTFPSKAARMQWLKSAGIVDKDFPQD